MGVQSRQKCEYSVVNLSKMILFFNTQTKIINIINFILWNYRKGRKSQFIGLSYPDIKISAEE